MGYRPPFPAGWAAATDLVDTDEARYLTAAGLYLLLDGNDPPSRDSRMLDAGTGVPWLAADEVYGQDPVLRDLCEERGVGYVLGVACSFPLTLPSRRADARGRGPGDGPRAGLDDHLMRCRFQGRPPLRLGVDRGRGPPAAPADPPQPARPRPRRLLLVLRARRPPGPPGSWSRSAAEGGPSRKTTNSGKTSSATTTPRSASTARSCGT